MKTFKDIIFNDRTNAFSANGKVSTTMFGNGYGVSVINDGYGSSEGLYELAVLNSKGQITYDTPITEDVIGFLTEEGVTSIMKKVQSL